MRSHVLTTLTAMLLIGSASAFGQGGGLSGVTMRVLDSLEDVDAVVLELDANRSGARERSAAGPGAAETPPAAADRERTAADEAREPARRDLGRDELHDVADDERAEGRLEDRDVERPAPAPAATP